MKKLHTARVVLGEHDKKSGDVVDAVYRDFYGKAVPPTIRTTLSIAELIKYASNSLLATKISYTNTIANLCERIPSADVKVVVTAMGLDKRIGPLFLNVGLGYGGSCFPKDFKALIAYSRKLGYPLELLEAAEEINTNQPLKAVEFCEVLIGNLKGKRIAILGLTFKADTDDIRKAKAIPIIKTLTRKGDGVVAYDPVGIPASRAIFQHQIDFASSATKCLKNANCCILVTEWDEFKKLKPDGFIKKHENTNTRRREESATQRNSAKNEFSRDRSWPIKKRWKG